MKNFNGYGRQIVKDQKTNRTFLIEPIVENENQTGNWGDVDPATKKITGEYDGKTRGAILEKESLITEGNGCFNIRTVNGSPYSEIEKMLKE